MIKTHMPRGPIFRCTSAFQRTHEIRNIVYDDCLAPPAKAIVPDEEDDWTSPERAAKRQRVEDLAQGYLDGQPLFISTALRHDWPRSTRKAVENESIVTVREGTTREALWEDVAEHPIFSGKECSKPGKGEETTSWHSSPTAPNEGTIREAAAKPANPASPQRKARTAPPQRRTRAQLLSAESSEISDITAQPLEKKMKNRGGAASASAAVSASEPSRQKTLCQKSTLTSNVELRVPGSTVHDDGSAAKNAPVDSHEPGGRATEDASETTLQSETSIAGGGERDQVTSQEQFLRMNGARASPRKSLFSTNGPSAIPQPLETEDVFQAKIGAVAAVSQGSSFGSAHGKALKPKRTSKSTAASRKKDAGRRKTAPSQSQRSIESEVTVVKQRSPTETKVKETNRPEDAADSPFAFKRGARAKQPKPEITKPISPQKHQVDSKKRIRRRITFPSSHNGQVTEKRPPAVTPAPPILDFSFGQDSSFAPGLNMALVNEHMNSVLPHEQCGEGKGSGVKRALRHEMRSSGADILRPADEPLSSQVEQELAQEEDNCIKRQPYDVQVASPRKAVESQLWPGTQNLLAQAQQDLFASPNKKAPQGKGEPPAETIHEEGQEDPRTHQDSHTGLPLSAPMSQKQVPSTQAMFAAWEPWSTVKKADCRKRKSFADSSATVMSNTTETPTAARPSRGNAQQSGNLERTRSRKSCLRNSTLMLQTPAQPTPAHGGDDQHPSSKKTSPRSFRSKGPDYSHTLVRSAPSPQHSSPAESQRGAQSSEATGRLDWSETDISTGEPLPSFQAAQLLSDDLNA